ncbi:hypothetical protein P280DRAFT_473314 [Massarina eburnea CBS 473.64]|uniref:Uncharacterized protein n=1 Tax=Massarina eburnea CBS 473.64 TaxID=1395130 RepID=A0A6A6RPQ7_9PLEO|nr:hypothetical protein P280DRAFT_473314 [Massarina eburnea CBS 473.64]
MILDTRTNSFLPADQRPDWNGSSCTLIFQKSSAVIAHIGAKQRGTRKKVIWKSSLYQGKQIGKNVP